ncbi:MAG: hypothetical protein K0S32_1442 [Bacteroidetes bacterium]|nr:hypothetical protein [Bacteroidota bacterium]
MANRAYLYSATNDFSKLRDLSESRHPIPLIYRIILGADTKLSNSRIWDFEHPIAIQGDFAKGLNRLYEFYSYLETQAGFNSSEIAEYKKQTKEFFEKQSDRVLDLFFLEGGEVFDLIADIDPIEKQNESLYEEIVSISKDITEILAKKPESIYGFKDAYWLRELKEDPKILEPYWTHVTYFSFNKSGQASQ